MFSVLRVLRLLVLEEFCRMPPKKKGKKSGKRKKSGKKSAKTSPSRAPSSDVLNELSKEYFLIQIRDLEARLARYQKKCDELELANQDYRSQYEQQTTDKKEIVSFLKKQLEQRADEIADLQDRLIGLQQAKDAEKDQYEVQLATLRTEMQEIKDQLTSENMVLGGKLASLEEFRVQKEDLMAKFAKMEEELERQQKDHKEVIYNLERKAVVDKDRFVIFVSEIGAQLLFLTLYLNIKSTIYNPICICSLVLLSPHLVVKSLGINITVPVILEWVISRLGPVFLMLDSPLITGMYPPWKKSLGSRLLDPTP